jgi:hypothetical protein
VGSKSAAGQIGRVTLQGPLLTESKVDDESLHPALFDQVKQRAVIQLGNGLTAKPEQAVSRRKLPRQADTW